MISTQVEAVKKRLVQEINVKIKLNWLGDCVNFFKQNDPSISLEKLYESTKEQLLLANYAHACDPVIPNAFRTIDTTWTFKERLFLQMEFVVDISEPFYEQWRRLHDIKLDDLQKEVKESRAFQVNKRRCLKLALFDGLNRVYAMEKRPIPCLTTKILPGIKVLIKGPVEVSNKIILLEAENITLVGGEVEEIQIENAYENVLLKRLGRPLTATPKTNYVENQPEIIIPPQSIPPLPSAPININPPPQVHDDLEKLSIDDDIDFEELDRIEAEFLRKQMLEQSALKEVQIPKTNASVEDSDEEIPESLIRELEEEFARSNATHQNVVVQDVKIDAEPNRKPILSKVPPQAKKLQKSPFSMPTVSRKLLTNPWTLSKRKTTLSNELPVSVKKPSFVHLQSNPKPSTSRLLPELTRKTLPVPKKPPKASELLIHDASLVNPVLDDDDYCNTLGEKRKSNEQSILEPQLKARRLSSPPRRGGGVTDDDYEYKIDFTYNFLTIDQFVELKIIDKVRKSYAMEVRVEKVIKLKIGIEWVLEVQVKDKWSSKLLSIKISNEIVANFAGCTAQEMTLMHQKAQIQPQLKDDLRKVLDRVNSALQHKTLLIVVTTKILSPTGFEVIMTQNLEMTDDNRHTIMLKLHDEKIQ